MNYKNVESVFKNDNHHWVGNGFRVKQYFPQGREIDFLDRFSPFILLDYNDPYFFKGTPFEVGVGPHPHRGFETVTFAFAGKVEHTDNKGNSGVINPGDIQWMTAGEGILHKEYHEREYAKRDRVFHMIQLWVNLPKKDKMTEPRYQAITKSEMGKYVSEDEKVEVIIYAGEAFGIKGPAKTYSPMNIYKVDIKDDTDILLEEKAEFNTGMLIMSGKAKINDDLIVKEGDFVLFENKGSVIKIRGIDEYTQIFVLSGKPLNEPVFAMGPFVMNTEDEVVQANVDFDTGVFGSLNF